MEKTTTKAAAPSTGPTIKVLKFTNQVWKDCIGVADIQIDNLIIRGIRFYIPSDHSKRPYIYWPSHKHGSSYVTSFQFADIPTDFRYKAYAARAIESYVSSIKQPSPRSTEGLSSQGSPSATGPPKAEIPDDLPT